MSLLTTSIILFLTALLSGLSIYFFRTNNKNLLKLLLAFSGAFLFSIAMLNILPEVFHESTNHFIGLFIIVGFVIQLLLDYLTHGVEHGHSHSELAKHDSHEHSTPYYALMIGICIHSFLEGMPFVEEIDANTRNSMLIGIVIHNLPIAIVLMSLFFQAGLSTKKSVSMLTIFALMTPLGAWFSNYFNEILHQQFEDYLSIIMAIVVGIFLHVSTSILFETTEHHAYNRKKLITVVIGIGAAVLSSLWHSH